MLISPGRLSNVLILSSFTMASTKYPSSSEKERYHLQCRLRDPPSWLTLELRAKSCNIVFTFQLRTVQMSMTQCCINFCTSFLMEEYKFEMRNVNADSPSIARNDIWNPLPDELPLATKSTHRFLECPVKMTGSSCERHVSKITPVLGLSAKKAYEFSRTELVTEAFSIGCVIPNPT